jgi:catechol-2,3-dioxygenase
MTPRVHVHLKASDLKASRTFYQEFLGVEPVKDKADHVKFLVPFAPLNLVISPARRQSAAESRGVVNHLGIELPSGATVQEHLERIKQRGLRVREQLNVNCCYANQSKFWIIDPDGTEWEVYHVNYDLIEKHGGGIEASSPSLGDRNATEGT